MVAEGEHCISRQSRLTIPAYAATCTAGLAHPTDGFAGHFDALLGQIAGGDAEVPRQPQPPEALLHLGDLCGFVALFRDQRSSLILSGEGGGKQHISKTVRDSGKQVDRKTGGQESRKARGKARREAREVPSHRRKKTGASKEAQASGVPVKASCRRMLLFGGPQSSGLKVDTKFKRDSPTYLFRDLWIIWA